MRSNAAGLTEAAILGFLRSVELGEVTLTPGVDPGEVYAGVVEYLGSNGWRIAIFNDCNEWDYIEWVDANGERVSFDEIDREMPEVARYEPSREVAEGAYKILRVATKLASSEDLDGDQRAFAQVHEVLRGKRRLPLDGRSSKMLRLLLDGDSDAKITPERFVVHFGTQKRRPSRYYRRLAPRVARELLSRAGIDSATSPVVLGLPAGEVPRTMAYPEWSYDAKVVWIAATAQEVKIVVRASTERWTAPFARTIPTEGPLALPELQEWVPNDTAVVHRTFETAFSCPHCGVGSTRFRQTGASALVCPRCARSFEDPHME